MIYKQVEVVPYNPNWPHMFALESNIIEIALGNNCVIIHHVGSTAVPNLLAKPKIDVIGVVKDPDQSILQLEKAGFSYRGEWNIPFKYGFTKRGEVDVNLHVFEEGHPEIEFNLLFRDYLREHPSVRDAYAALKEKLLKDESSFQKNDSMFAGYTLGKEAFISQIVHQTGFNKLRFTHCTHIREWEKAKDLRQKYFFDQVPIDDPYTWTFNHNSHVHFVLYQGIKIIGYAHIQLWPESKAALRIIVIDEPFRAKGWGGYFLRLCEKWLKKEGIKILHTESSPFSRGFYEKYQYQEMPFNDPEGYERGPEDIAMGKRL